MRILVTSGVTGRVTECELSEALQPQVYEQGHIEQVQALANANAAAIGHILAKLVENGVMTLEEARDASGTLNELRVLK